MAKVLVVDDEDDLREDLEWAAQGPEREVLAVGNAKDAISRIDQDLFDVVVTDLKMETSEAGFEVLKAAKAKDTYTQVIMITVYGTPAISIEAMRLGAFDYLERNSPGTDSLAMLKTKITLALEFRNAKLKESGLQ